MVQPAGLSGPTHLSVASKTDPGLSPDKQINEDACADAVVPSGHLLLVCDGMGGHASGQEASRLAVQTILRELGQPSALPPGAALQRAIAIAGRAVYDLGGATQSHLRPGSTCVALLVHSAGTEVAHVGDSRAYMMREGQIYALTKDHSMVQQMVDAGVLTPEEAAVHPDANKITRALGMMADVEVELRAAPVGQALGDVYLLASDGLCDLVSPQEMLATTTQALSIRGLGFACEQLVSLANARGGHDNITVLMAQVTAQPQQQEFVGRPTIPEGVAVDALPLAPPTLPELPTIPEAPSLDMEAGQARTHVLRGGGHHVPTPAAAPSPLAMGKPASGVGPAPTMVDDGEGPSLAPGMGSGAHAAPAASWQQQQPWPPDRRAPQSNRHAVAILLGLVMLGTGLLIIALFAWWVIAKGSASDAPGEENPAASATILPPASASATPSAAASEAWPAPSASAWSRRRPKR